METKEIASKLTGMAGIETSALYSQRVVLTAAAERLSEQQQVIDEMKHLLMDVDDGAVEADGRGDDGIIDMQIVRNIRETLTRLKTKESE